MMMMMSETRALVCLVCPSVCLNLSAEINGLCVCVSWSLLSLISDSLSPPLIQTSWLITHWRDHEARTQWPGLGTSNHSSGSHHHWLINVSSLKEKNGGHHLGRGTDNIEQSARSHASVIQWNWLGCLWGEEVPLASGVAPQASWVMMIWHPCAKVLTSGGERRKCVTKKGGSLLFSFQWKPSTRGSIGGRGRFTHFGWELRGKSSRQIYFRDTLESLSLTFAWVHWKWYVCVWIELDTMF